MLGAIKSSELVKGSESITVEVAREAKLQFEDSISLAESAWVLMEGEEVRANCSSVGGTPRPVMLGYLGEDQLEAEIEEEGEEVRLSFSLIPSKEDSGKYLRCSSIQTDEDGMALFFGSQEITKKVR